jgi:hypothetical protein
MSRSATTTDTNLDLDPYELAELAAKGMDHYRTLAAEAAAAGDAAAVAFYTEAAEGMELTWLCESIGWLWESYGETDAQYRSECALYGDAGPGQAAMVRGCREAAEAAERRACYLEDTLGRGPVRRPTALDVPDAAAQGYEDEPF